MCGIAGWVSYRSDLTAERDTLLAMTRTLAARGPDGEGLWADTHVALGHRRLAVIDPDGGAQPMSAMSNGRTVAVATYNGEIYNYRELRHELELAGHTFDTRSDTEVMLHAYLQWDVDFVSRLNGMYAIAIWDARTEELLLVRDRLGVKPLYYAPLPGGVLFGSEPKAILAHREFSARVTPEGLAGLLTNLRSPGYAPLRGLREVRPGHLVKVSRSGCTERRYWGWTHTTIPMTSARRSARSAACSKTSSTAKWSPMSHCVRCCPEGSTPAPSPPWRPEHLTRRSARTRWTSPRRPGSCPIRSGRVLTRRSPH
ncbi:hypothetical protein GCM10029963_00350 [Micromonospora andamanensis]